MIHEFCNRWFRVQFEVHQVEDALLYCIMRPYTEGQLDGYHIGIPRENPKFGGSNYDSL